MIFYELYFVSEGRKHDAGMLADSGLLNDMRNFAFSPAGQPVCVYGDPAYPLRIHFQAQVRVSVEWLFGDIINFFKFLDYKKNPKVGLSSVGKMYIVCALLRNAITCLYGNQTSEFFDLEPPTFEEYF